MKRFSSLLTCCALLVCALDGLYAQATADTSKASAKPVPKWFKEVRYGGGPSVGFPRSDFDGSKPPASWCLTPQGRATGDYGMAGWPWMKASQGWLFQVLSDTGSLGDGWRKVLGGAPRLASGDSVVHVLDEDACRAIAAIINRDVLGWEVGPPPVVVFRVRDYLVAYPSNAPRGHFGIAVGMASTYEIRGVAAW